MDHIGFRGTHKGFNILRLEASAFNIEKVCAVSVKSALLPQVDRHG